LPSSSGAGARASACASTRCRLEAGVRRRRGEDRPQGARPSTGPLTLVALRELPWRIVDERRTGRPDAVVSRGSTPWMPIPWASRWQVVGVSDQIRVWRRSSDPFPYSAAADLLVRLRVRIRSVHSLEALASGPPLVVTRCAGVSELVEDANHALVVDDPEDVRELAPGIGRALDAGLGSLLTQNGRELAKR
jgi:glycosyltransferase involved in cell wall biosynthesis